MDQTHQVHLNVFVQDAEDAYQAAQAALDDYHAKVEALKGQLLPVAQPTLPEPQAEKPAKKSK